MLIVAAEGGMGKTRLAAEFAQALRAKQWRAGFAVLAQMNRWPSLATEGDTLLIIDYPESDIAALQHLMALANRFDAPTHRLRILLLTRNETDIRNALQAGQATHLSEANALKIDSVAVNAYALFESARCATLIASGAAVKPYDQARFDAWQHSSVLHESPLFLLAAGITAARASKAYESLAVGYDLIAQMVDNELSKIGNAGQASGATSDSAQDAVAFATLFDGLALSRFDAAGDAATALMLKDTPALRQALTHTAHAHVSSADGSALVPRIEPDLYAAVFIERWHQRRNQTAPAAGREQLASALWRDAEADAAVRILARWNLLAYDLAFRLERTNIVDQLLCGIVNNTSGDSILRAFNFGQWLGLPATSAAVAARQIHSSNADPEESRGDRLHNASIDLHTAGQHQEALTAAREAVEIGRRLAKANPAADVPDLAASLSNFANRQSATGDRTGALASAREAVEIRRRLAKANSAAYEPALAISLTNFANRQSETGDRTGALATACEAVEILRRLAKANPAAYEPGLARSLCVLALAMERCGEPANAHWVAKEAVMLLAPCAQQMPDAFAALRDSAQELTEHLSAAAVEVANPQPD